MSLYLIAGAFGLVLAFLIYIGKICSTYKQDIRAPSNGIKVKVTETNCRDIAVKIDPDENLKEIKVLGGEVSVSSGNDASISASHSAIEIDSAYSEKSDQQIFKTVRDDHIITQPFQLQREPSSIRVDYEEICSKIDNELLLERDNPDKIGEAFGKGLLEGQEEPSLSEELSGRLSPETPQFLESKKPKTSIDLSGIQLASAELMKSISLSSLEINKITIDEEAVSSGPSKTVRLKISGLAELLKNYNVVFEDLSDQEQPEQGINLEQKGPKETNQTYEKVLLRKSYNNKAQRTPKTNSSFSNLPRDSFFSSSHGDTETIERDIESGYKGSQPNFSNLRQNNRSASNLSTGTKSQKRLSYIRANTFGSVQYNSAYSANHLEESTRLEQNQGNSISTPSIDSAAFVKQSFDSDLNSTQHNSNNTLPKMSSGKVSKSKLHRIQSVEVEEIGNKTAQEPKKLHSRANSELTIASSYQEDNSVENVHINEEDLQVIRQLTTAEVTHTHNIGGVSTGTEPSSNKSSKYPTLERARLNKKLQQAETMITSLIINPVNHINSLHLSEAESEVIRQRFKSTDLHGSIKRNERHFIQSGEVDDEHAKASMEALNSLGSRTVNSSPRSSLLNDIDMPKQVEMVGSDLIQIAAQNLANSARIDGNRTSNKTTTSEDTLQISTSSSPEMKRKGQKQIFSNPIQECTIIDKDTKLEQTMVTTRKQTNILSQPIVGSKTGLKPMVSEYKDDLGVLKFTVSDLGSNSTPHMNFRMIQEEKQARVRIPTQSMEPIYHQVDLTHLNIDKSTSFSQPCLHQDNLASININNIIEDMQMQTAKKPKINILPQGTISKTNITSRSLTTSLFDLMPENNSKDKHDTGSLYANASASTSTEFIGLQNYGTERAPIAVDKQIEDLKLQLEDFSNDNMKIITENADIVALHFGKSDSSNHASNSSNSNGHMHSGLKTALIKIVIF